MSKTAATARETISQPDQMSVVKTVYPILFLISTIHLFNDAIQAVFPATFPNLKTDMGLIFCFLAAGAVGTFFGGPIGDRFGRRNLIFLSMIGSAPLALLLPFCGPIATYFVLISLGFILL